MSPKRPKVPGNRWVITSEQLDNLRGNAHRLLDHLTVMSGYGELALDSECRPDRKRELRSIVGAARFAKSEVLSGVAVLDSLVPYRRERD